MAGPRTMAVPLAIDALGRVAFTEDPLQQMQDKVHMVVATRVRERMMRPDYGCDIQAYLFAVDDNITATMLETEISTAMAKWLPQVEVIDVNLLMNEDTTLAISMDYSIPTATSATPTVFSAIINVGGTMVGV